MHRKLNRNVRVLLIESNRDDIVAIKKEFANADFQVDIKTIDQLGRLDEYLESAKLRIDWIPDVILLDMSFFDAGLRTVLNKSRSVDILVKVPVIIIITSKAERDVVKTYTLDVAEIITKPLEADKVFSVLKLDASANS